MILDASEDVLKVCLSVSLVPEVAATQTKPTDAGYEKP